MEYLPREDYLEAAKLLPLGGSARIGHHCGPGSVLKINHTTEGFSGYCFRCGIHGFTPIERKKLSDFDIIKQRVIAKEFRKEVKLPEDFTLDIPDSRALWFWKFGFDREMCRTQGLGYSPSMNRLVMPIYEDGKLVYIQARACDFPEQQPKYLDSGDKYVITPIYSPIKPVLSNAVVLTEDIMSARKVGLVTTASPVLGTKLSTHQTAMYSKYGEVLWWLDGDGAGITGLNKGRRKLAMLGCTQRAIISAKDPKYYSTRVISEALRENYASFTYRTY